MGSLLTWTTLMLNEETMNYCRVCGFKEDYPPWGDDGSSPTFNFCTCCGVEFGYEDASLLGIRRHREKWIRTGAQWSDPEHRPTDWNLDEQLKNIPVDFI